MLRYSLEVHDHAWADIDALWVTEPTAAARIEALLEQIAGDQYLLESLTIRDFGADESADFHVDDWWLQHKHEQRNIWRLKIWDLEKRGIKYRILYALDSRDTTYSVLGVLPRKFDYDPKNPRAKQLLDAYDELGIPRY